MAHAGYFPIEELKTLRKFGSRLQGHPEREKLPGLETTSGPLGSGLGEASGIAYGLRMDGKKSRVYCLMSDGEQEEGNTWESVMFAGKYKQANLTAIVDRNNIIEAHKAILAAAQYSGPIYVRLGREKTPIVTTADTPFSIGKAEVYRQGSDVAIVVCGILTHQALLAAEELANDGIDAMVINSHTVKPLDKETIRAAAKHCGAVVSVEEHQVFGGFGSAVAECLALNYPTPMEFIGSQDRFGESGKASELIEHFGLGKDAIKTAAKKVLIRK